MNLKNGKFYIGKHKTDNLDDGYLGSGNILKGAIRKYGKDYFIREILFICKNEEEMDIIESKVVNNELINNPFCYNLREGGLGGKLTERSKNLLREKNLGKVQSDETKDKISKSKLGTRLTKEHVDKIQKSRKGYQHSDETKQKIKLSLIGNKHSKETRRKQSEKKKGKSFSLDHKRRISEGLIKKDGVVKLNLPVYDTFCEYFNEDEIKRDDNNSKILQIKCHICGDWFIPTRIQVRNRCACIKGLRKGQSYIYCKKHRE